MRKIPLKEAKPGMVLAKPVFKMDDGKLLLPANFELTPLYIDKIGQYGCSDLYIQDSGAAEIKITPRGFILGKTKVKAYSVLQETIGQILDEGEIDPAKVREAVDQIINDILSNSHTIYNMYNLESHDDYTFSHSVNVCVLATLIGSVMGYNRNELDIIATGALLHDIGKVKINPGILNKPAKLSFSEFEEVKKHPLYGAELIQKTGAMGFLTASLALQHHEREDGSGYPNRADSKGIHPFAKIVSVADVFDAMTAERVYKKASPPHAAIQELRSQVDKKYNRSVVEHFLKVVVPYPIGTDIVLQGGEKIKVVDILEGKSSVVVKNSSGQARQYCIDELESRLESCS